MVFKESTRRKINIAYISVTAVSALFICLATVMLVCLACGICDDTIFLTDGGYAVHGFEFCILNMVISGLMKFCNKLFCRISFIVGLANLALFVSWYNCILVFRPDLYVILL